jgi:hypothetical protein
MSCWRIDSLDAITKSRGTIFNLETPGHVTRSCDHGISMYRVGAENPLNMVCTVE